MIFSTFMFDYREQAESFIEISKKYGFTLREICKFFRIICLLNNDVTETDKTFVSFDILEEVILDDGLKNYEIDDTDKWYLIVFDFCIHEESSQADLFLDFLSHDNISISLETIFTFIPRIRITNKTLKYCFKLLIVLKKLIKNKPKFNDIYNESEELLLKNISKKELMDLLSEYMFKK